ncbi:patatin-like phospholipase family protein [Oleidesulfovibrio sp.]|uniref:patatin-like phospholipase family protein n=1 Tax=Oleidesulfovibrio sp. TaxID=2909707 RepID=UPI003A8A0586
MYTNLVFKGGGVKGVAYAGALKVLERHGLLLPVRRVAGASSGAMAAAFLALGASPADMAEIVLRTPFKRFMDTSGWIGGDIRRLLTEYGWFKGDVLGRWVRSNVQVLTGNAQLTFGELRERAIAQPEKYRDLTVVGANLTLQSPELFDADSTPELPVWEAVRISMGIPLFFKAMRGSRGDLLVDGSVTWNYPISLFDQRKFMNGSKPPEGAESPGFMMGGGVPGEVFNPSTLGFMVETRDNEEARMQHPAGNIEGFGAYLRSIIGFMTDVSCSSFLSEADWKRTVFIEALGVRTTDFSISKDMVARLIDSGEKGAELYFEKILRQK